MFTKFGNNREKVIAQAKSHGFVENVSLNSGTKLFTYLTRVDNGILSLVSVSYIRKSPMVEIRHKYDDGTQEIFQMVLVDKRAWLRIVGKLIP